MGVAARRPVRTFSLRAHLLALVVGTLLPALVLAAFLVRRVVADNRAAVEQRLLEAARAESALVDAELVGTVRALQGLAQSDRLSAGDMPAFYAQALGLLETQPTWSAVTLLTPAGRQILNTARPVGEELVAVVDPDSLSRAAQARVPAIGNMRIGQVTHQLGFPVRVPVVRENRVVYVVSAWITSTGFATILRREPFMSEEWVRGIVDDGGTIVARSRDADRYVGQKGTASFADRVRSADSGVYRDMAVDGTVVYGAFSRAPVSRWIAGVAVPASVVDASFRRSMIALAAVAILLFGVGGTGAYAISRGIADDIRQSANEAEAIAGGLRPTTRWSGVTEIQRLHDALARSAALLETRQRERDEQLARADEARAEAEAADRAKDQFLAMLGHELRNPLAPALTALHLMKMRGGDSSRERDVIERQIRHMSRLVDDLLDVSRLQRGAIELRRERFDLADAVARAVEMTSPAFAEKQQRLDIEVPRGLVLDADQIRIAQVLANLLTNAAKYTDPGGHIELRARQDDGFAIVECCDNGMGMPPDLVPRVFDLFVQGERGIDRQQGGLGLGLAVARTLIQLHDGTIEARSPGVNQGSTFTVRLPLAPARAAAPPIGEPAPAVGLDPSRAAGPVMVVDDNGDALEMLLLALQHSGMSVVGASTAAEALALSDRVQPAVAVVDIGLPGMNGFDLARELRSRAHGRPLRLIALTGYGHQHDIATANAAGFDAFFVKPVEISALVVAVSQPLA